MLGSESESETTTVTGAVGVPPGTHAFDRYHAWRGSAAASEPQGPEPTTVTVMRSISMYSNLFCAVCNGSHGLGGLAYLRHHESMTLICAYLFAADDT